MALPTRAKQIQEVAKFLDSDQIEGLSLDQVATKIVDAYHDLLTAGIKKPVTNLHVGLTFKSPFTTKVHHVAWGDTEKVWIITADARYGWIGSYDDPFWRYVEESTAKAGAPNNNPKWSAGQTVSQHQRQFKYEILATGDKCVLLKDVATGEIKSESNDNMEKYYRLERAVVEMDW